MKERLINHDLPDIVKAPPLPLNELTAISPVDGRYAQKVASLRGYFSEYALMKGRVYVEIKWLEKLSSLGIGKQFSLEEIKNLENIWQDFSVTDAKSIKKIEKTTRHDVKAVEYFLKRKLKKIDMSDVLEMAHLGLTSEDVTNLSQNIYLSKAKDEILVPSVWRLIDTICEKATEYKVQPIIARTHAKMAVSTTVGKELALFAYRLSEEVKILTEIKLTGKLTGAVGNLNALKFALPDHDWIKISKDFVKELGLEPMPYTTQIEPHDRWAAIFNNLSRVNTIVKSLDKNLWNYILLNYIKLAPKKGQTGSSTMPHKGRNPINIENSEGVSEVANFLLDGFASVLPDSRLQRHLSDSTIARNIGLALADCLLVWENAASDIKDIQINKVKIDQDLEESWPTVLEGLQTRMRVIGIRRPYEKTAKLAQECEIDSRSLDDFISGLRISDDEKTYLRTISPENYIGEAEKLTNMMLDDISLIRR